MGLEFRNAVLGSGDPAVELLDGRLPVSDPVPLGASHTPRADWATRRHRCRSRRAMSESHPTLGVLALAARLVEIARSTASGGPMPAIGAADEVVTAATNAVKIDAAISARVEADRAKSNGHASGTTAERGGKSSQGRKRRKRP